MTIQESLVTPKELGHNMQPHPTLGQMCSKCGSMPGSPDGNLPCGNRNGRGVSRKAGVRHDRHVWYYELGGKIIGYSYLRS